MSKPERAQLLMHGIDTWTDFLNSLSPKIKHSEQDIIFVWPGTGSIKLSTVRARVRDEAKGDSFSRLMLSPC